MVETNGPELESEIKSKIKTAIALLKENGYEIREPRAIASAYLPTAEDGTIINSKREYNDDFTVFYRYWLDDNMDNMHVSVNYDPNAAYVELSGNDIYDINVVGYNIMSNGKLVPKG